MVTVGTQRLGAMNVKAKGVFWVVLGLALIFLSLILEVFFYVPDLQHPASSTINYLGLNALHPHSPDSVLNFGAAFAIQI
jgi:hypothetical protein